MSAQETTVFDCSSIGDDQSAKDHRGRAKYSLARIKQSIDDCSNPPHYRGVKTPVTDILDQAPPTLTKEKRDQTKEQSRKEAPKVENTAKEKRDQTKPTPNSAHLARRPDHEQPSKLPAGLKRPDLEALVDGNKIASEVQRQLYDDIKRGYCTRCHKGGHIRKDCKEPKTKWEEKFDKEKIQYWDSVVKWQARATTGSKPPPTLHQKTAPKPEQRASSIASDSDEDNSTAFPPLHYRLTMDADSDDDDNHAVSNIVAGLGEIGMTTDVDMTTEESPSVSPFFQDNYIE
jgi:hypothetical protein